ncbi:DsrE family protein [Chloroflexota bacterium]
MKAGIIIYSNEPETVWNAFRFGNFALAMGDEVNVFLLGKGVEVESLDMEKFQVLEQLQEFIGSDGKLFACGTCLEIHQIDASDIYKVSTLKELYDLVKESERIITF